MAKQCLGILAIVLAGMFALIMPIWGATCPSRPACITAYTPVKVVVSFDKARPFIDSSHSRRWIRNKARAYSSGHHPVGLTETHLFHRLTASFTSCSYTNKREQCIYLAKATLMVGYSDTKVFIAHEYRPGSCEYRAIYQHEAEHVRILNEHQERFLPILQADLRNFVRNIRPLSSRNPQRGQKKIMNKLERSMKRKFRRLERSLKSAHAIIDTPRSYAKIQAGCQKW